MIQEAVLVSVQIHLFVGMLKRPIHGQRCQLNLILDTVGQLEQVQLVTMFVLAYHSEWANGDCFATASAASPPPPPRDDNPPSNEQPVPPVVEVPVEKPVHRITIDPPSNGEIKITYLDTNAKSVNVTKTCPNDCVADVTGGVDVRLRAMPDLANGYIFLGWKNISSTACLSSNERQNINPSFRIASNCEVSAEFGKDAEKEALKDDIRSLNGEVTRLNNELGNANQKIGDLSRKISEQEGNIEDLENQLEIVREENRERDEQIKDLREQVVELEEKAKEVDGLKEELDGIKTKLEDTEDALRNLEGELIEVEAELKKLRDEISQRDFLEGLIPTPSSNTRDIDYNSDLELSWIAGEDPEELFNQSTFSVYLQSVQGVNIALTGCDNLAPNQSCTVSAESLERDQTYVWGVSVNGNEARKTVWSFSTKSNTAPVAPTYISPENGKEGIDPKNALELSWNESFDADGDTLTYDCRYQKVGGSPQLCTLNDNNTKGSIKKDALEHEAQYEWWVEVSDSIAQPVKGEKWTFSTISAPIGLKLEAISGYNSTLLKWEFSNNSFNNNADIEYHILRAEKTEGTSVLNYPDDLIGSVNGANSSCHDEGNAEEESVDNCGSPSNEVLEKKTDYCYGVYAVVEEVVYRSEQACVTFGQVILAIESQRSDISDGFVTIPISILNAGGLEIDNGDIVFQYDTKYFSYSEVVAGDLGDLGLEGKENEQGGIVRFSFSTSDRDPLIGEGALFRVKLELTDAAINSEDEVSADFSLLNDGVIDGVIYVTSIYDADLNEVQLKLIGDSIRLNRDRRESVTAKVTLTKAYFRGDLNGDGRKLTVDAVLARRIGVGRIQDFTDEEYNAGKVNFDELVNSNDARMIIYHVLNGGVWPDEIQRQTRSGRNLRSDRVRETVVLRLNDIQANSGEEVETVLSVENLSDLAATNLVLVYDTNVVAGITRVTRTGIASKASLEYRDNGMGLLRIGLDSQDPISGSGDIAIIKLRLKTSDSITTKTSGFRIAHTLLYDVYGRNMSTSELQTMIEADNATITLNDIVEPEKSEIQPAIKPLPENDPSQQAIYSIIGKVIDVRGNAINGVTITAGDKTIVTDNFFWILQGYAEGSYTVNAIKEGYSFAPQTCVLGGNLNCSVTFLAKSNANDIFDEDSENGDTTIGGSDVSRFQATIKVLDKAGQGITGISIEVGGETYVTDVNGEVNIHEMLEGKYTVAILTALDYVYEAKDFTVSSNTRHAKVYLKPSAPKFTVKTQWTPTKVYEGDTSGMLYQPVITNKGEKIATNVQLSFNLAPNATATSAKVDAPEGVDAGTCNIAGQVITCDIMDLLPNEAITVSIVAVPTGTDTMVNVAQISSAEYPTHTDTLSVGITPYFSVNSWPIPNRVLKDNYAVLRIRLSNNPFNSAEVNNLSSQLHLPLGVEFVSYQTDDGNCQYAEHTLTCNVNPIPVGEYVDVDVTVKSSVVGEHAYKVLTTSNFPDQETNRKLAVISPLPQMPGNADIFIAFDTTGSMDDNLEAAKGAVKQFVEIAKDKAVKPKIGLVFFKDDAQVVLVTDDLQLVIDKLDSVVPSGGDEKYFCREASEQAIIKALDSLKVKDGVILLVTDAPPHPDTNLNTALSIMKSPERSVIFNALVAGDECNAAKFNAELQERLNTRRLRISRECDTTTAEETADMRELYQCMADETGGKLFDHDVVNSGNASDIAAKQADILAVLTGVLDDLLKTIPQDNEADNNDAAKNGNREKLLAVDPETSAILATPVPDSFWVFVGSPNGRVVSQPAGIDCDRGYGQCFYYFKTGTKLKLIPTAPEGLFFAGWRGDGCEKGEFTVTGMKGCSAYFYGVSK
jgi:hypothetical protein